jgi:hypothetical protein
MENEKLHECLEKYGFFGLDLEEALSHASDVEILSIVEKLTLSEDLSWDRGIPLYKKADLNILLQVLIAELKARFYMRIAPKEHNIADVEKPKPKQVKKT